MEVEFRRIQEARYCVEVRRDRFPNLVGMESPYLAHEIPHDAFHFVAEAEIGLRRAIFGQLAVGGSSMFDLGVISGAQGRELSRIRRKAKNLNQKLALAGRREMEWSERLVGLLHYEWLHRSTSPARQRRATTLVDRVDRIRSASSAEELESLHQSVIERVCARLEDISSRWHRLHVGAGVTVTWPYPEGQPTQNRESRRLRARA